MCIRDRQEPEKPEDINLSSELLQMNDGSQFLLAHDSSVPQKRVLIFSSRKESPAFNEKKRYLWMEHLKAQQTIRPTVYNPYRGFDSRYNVILYWCYSLLSRIRKKRRKIYRSSKLLTIRSWI